MSLRARKISGKSDEVACPGLIEELTEGNPLAKRDKSVIEKNKEGTGYEKSEQFQGPVSRLTLERAMGLGQNGKQLIHSGQYQVDIELDTVPKPHCKRSWSESGRPFRIICPA
jgi:hypothetical protein